MKRKWRLRVLATVTVLTLLLTVIQLPLSVRADNTRGTETIVAEVVNRDGVSGVDSTKTNYFNKYRVAGKSTSFGSYGHIQSVIKIGGSGRALNSSQTFLFDLNDATVSFTPYIATFTYKSKLSIYGSKDGELWLPLVINEEPGDYARKGNNAEWNPDGDVTELGALTAWSNYNTANMNAILSDNAEKKVYIKFCYVGDGTDATGQAEAKAFGVTAAYDTAATVSAETGVENYLSSAGNRSAEGSYWNNTAPENDSTKATYFQKYMVVAESKYRGNSYVAELRKDQTGDKLVFKYDLNDSTTGFIPAVWVNTATDANIKIEASKDGAKWYTIVNEDVKGNGVSNGIVYGDTDNVAFIDTGASNFCTSKEWTTYNEDIIPFILSENEEKTVYLRFSRGEAPASGYAAENFEYRGFGITAYWDKTAVEIPATDTETYVAEVVNRDGLAAVDSNKGNYFNKNFVASQSTRFVTITGADFVVKIGGAYTNGFKGSYVFKYNLDDSTVSFTPHIATVDYTAKICVYGSKDGKNWLPLVENEALASNAYYGDVLSFFPNNDVVSKGSVTAWKNYNYKNMDAVLADNPTKTVYLKFEYAGNGTDEAQLRAFGISSVWNKTAERVPATKGVENFISNASNRDGYGTTNPSAASYFGKYLVTEQSHFHPLNFLVKLYIPAHQLVFKYDLNDATKTFTPYLWGSGDCNAKVTVEASSDGKNWLKIVDAEQVLKAHYGDVQNTAHTFSTGVSEKVNAWSNLNTANIAKVLENNPDKIVYLKYSYAGDYNKDGHATVECQLQGFGITGVWDKTGYETFVGEAINRDDLPGNGSVHTDGEGQAKENYFNKYIVKEQSSYTSLNASLIKLGGRYAKNGYLTFKYDLNDNATAFYPYTYVGGDYTAKLDILASADGENWLSIVKGETMTKGEFIGDAESFKPHSDVVNTGDLRLWKNYNVGNMRVVLSNNPEKTVYIKFVYNGTGDDEAQLSAFGLSAAYDAAPAADPSVAVGKTDVVIREEIYAAADNRDGYEGVNPDADDYLGKYLVKDKSSFTGVYHLAKLVKGDKVIVKFDLTDKTTDFTPWLDVGGDKYSTVKVSGSKDGENWLTLCNKADAVPGTAFGKDTPWPAFNSGNMKKLLEGNSKKIVYLCFEYTGGAYNPVTKKNDEETQAEGFGIIGTHKAKALSAEVTALPKTEYAIGDEELDTDGGVITVKYDTGEVIAHPFAVADVRGFEAALPGEQTIYVEMHGIVASYKITVDSQPIKSVEVTTLPSALEFEVGEALSTKGGKITVTFEDDTTDERNLVNSMIIGFDNSKITDKLTLTVIVGDARDEYDVKIIEKTRIESEEIRIDATPFVTPDGVLEMINPEDQEEDHKKLLADRKKNGRENDLDLGEIITDSSLALTTPTNSAGVSMNVFAGGHFTFEMDLDDRAVSFELTRGWGTYSNMKILASKDGGKTWYLIGRVLSEVSGRNTVFTSSDLTQEEIDKNIEWILTGNPEKKFLMKYEADSYGAVEGNIQISNIMMNVYSVKGPRLHKDLPTTVPEGYEVPRAYTFGMLKSEQNIEDDGDEIVLPDEEIFEPAPEEPEEEEPVDTEKPTGEKKLNVMNIIIYIICGIVIAGSWTVIALMLVKLRKKRRA